MINQSKKSQIANKKELSIKKVYKCPESNSPAKGYLKCLIK